MSFNLSTFRSIVGARGGPANDNQFEVTISPSNTFQSRLNTLGVAITNDMRFFCESVQIPGHTLSTTDVMRQGYGFSQKSVTGMTFDPLTLIYMVDGNYDVIKFFRAWHDSIINHDNRSPNKSRDGMLPFELNYRNQYQCDMTIIIYPTKLPYKKYTYKIGGAYPSSIGSTQLGWSNNNAILKQNIQIEYTSITNEGMDNRSGVEDESPISEITN